MKEAYVFFCRLTWLRPHSPPSYHSHPVYSIGRLQREKKDSERARDKRHIGRDIVGDRTNVGPQIFSANRQSENLQTIFFLFAGFPHMWQFADLRFANQIMRYRMTSTYPTNTLGLNYKFLLYKIFRCPS